MTEDIAAIVIDDGSGNGIADLIEKYLQENKVMIFSKSYCPYCNKVKRLFKSINQEFTAVELDKRADGDNIKKELLSRTGLATVPSVFVAGNHVGGYDATLSAQRSGRLEALLNFRASQDQQEDAELDAKYNYDLVVIGGGSGGLAASKEAALLGKKVAVCDFVKPTPIGTTWGLGGTCVNVGCIPKKLMHQSALIGKYLDDSHAFGWNTPDKVKHDWNKMVEKIQVHIKSLNWGYRVQLRDKKVDYINAYASFLDPHTLKTVDKRNKERIITARHIVIATGGRPRYPSIPGAKEYCITSDDIFSLPHSPGKTLCVGASYIALECAGFLKGLGLEVEVMVRSILLRGFDQQMAELIGKNMEKEGVKFSRGFVPIKIEKVEDGSASEEKPPTLKVTSKHQESGEIREDIYNTVLFAIGRDACTDEIAADKAGIVLNPLNGKVIVDEAERTNVENIFAIGDVLDGKLELTPVAIQAGIQLSRRLYGGQNSLMDYNNVPTTVYTPIEYGSVGFSEEAAIERFGPDNIEIYHKYFTPLEYKLPEKGENDGYAKLICIKSLKKRVVGLHYFGPNAGEITQGFALGLKLNASKADFDNLVGIHPTTAEVFTTLRFTKASGQDVHEKGC
ncbi:thioredoxin reductase 1, cytoplasmic-like [Artemia franciscana]|uniref:thioredoxin reductase 1, cytoplasmic-like n=1 Tax=Artemia franciscana TaxID=6661 RepID=UPI0032DB7BCA